MPSPACTATKSLDQLKDGEFYHDSWVLLDRPGNYSMVLLSIKQTDHRRWNTQEWWTEDQFFTEMLNSKKKVFWSGEQFHARLLRIPRRTGVQINMFDLRNRYLCPPDWTNYRQITKRFSFSGNEWYHQRITKNGDKATLLWAEQSCRPQVLIDSPFIGGPCI